MKLLTEALRVRLRANSLAQGDTETRGERSPDPLPVVRFFNPVGHATWIATELDEDGILFGLADLGFGCPELGSFSLRELEGLRLPFGMAIERDLHFRPVHSLSVYAEAARRAGSLVLAERLLLAADRRLRGGR